MYKRCKCQYKRMYRKKREKKNKYFILNKNKRDMLVNRLGSYLLDYNINFLCLIKIHSMIVHSMAAWNEYKKKKRRKNARSNGKHRPIYMTDEYIERSEG